MPYQPRSTTTPLFSPDSVPDFATTYSSFEHSQPGFRFLSNDPLAPNALSPRPRPLHQQNQPLLHHHQGDDDDDAPAPPPLDAIIKSRYPGSDDSDFVDLLYIVDASGKTSVTDITTPETAALAQQHASQKHAAAAASAPCPPPHTNAFELPSTTPTPTTTTAAEAGSETSSLSDYEDLSPDDTNLNELDYYAKLMGWWPSAEADELKVERM